MQRWLWSKIGAWARRAAAAALVGGAGRGGSRPVPRHIAFIMDGNRRFAEARSLRKVEGHVFGYRRLIDALEWCLDLGVCCVSVYAFSIDNYRRSGEEVQTLMALAEEKLAHMLQECEVLERHGVQVRVIGDLSLAPQAVQDAAAAIMRATAHHDRAVLNLCFSYTASEELLQAMDTLAGSATNPFGGSNSRGAQGSSTAQPFSTTPSRSGGSGASSSSSSSAAAALEQRLYTAGCPPVDLLVRTSGETRLSDFLLWQCRHALLIFTPVLWPDFGFLDLVAAVLEFQRHAAHLRRLQAVAERQMAAAVSAAAGAEGAAAGVAAGTAAVAAAERAPSLPSWPLQQPALRPVKLAASAQRQQQQRGSPCSIASPASPSSPSSRSDASSAGEAATAAGGVPTAAAATSGPAVALPLRQRHASGAAASRAVL